MLERMRSAIAEWSEGHELRSFQWSSRDRANRIFLERLEGALRNHVPDGEGLEIYFEPYDRWSYQDDNAFGYYSGSIDGKSRALHVRLPQYFDARDLRHAAMVAQIGFHEATHDIQYQSLQSAFSAPVDRDIAIDLAAHAGDNDGSRYHSGYAHRPFEVQANFLSLSHARGVLRDFFDAEKVDDTLVEFYRSCYASWYDELSDGAVSRAGTYDEMHSAMSLVFGRVLLHGTPTPCAKDSYIGNYLGDYASEEFMDAWKGAATELDRDKLAIVGTMVYRMANHVDVGAQDDARRYFAWPHVDWTLSDGRNAMLLTGVFDAEGKTIPDAMEGLKPCRIYDERRWMTDLDVACRMVEWLGRGEDANAHLEYADGKSGGIASGVWTFPDGKVESLGNMTAEKARLMDMVANGRLVVVTHEGADPMPESVRTWLNVRESEVERQRQSAAKTPIATGYARGGSVMPSGYGMQDGYGIA